MMKVLYVSDYLMLGHSGGAHLSQAHLKTLKLIFGQDNVKVFALTYAQDVQSSEYECIRSYSSNIGQLINIVQGNPHAFNEKSNKRILQIIQTEKIELIFLDNGYFGKQCKLVKKMFPNIPIIVFNHGILRSKTNQQINERKSNPAYWPQIYGLLRGEKQTSKYADVILAINSRDAGEYKNAYHRDVDYILPVYIEDMKGVSEDLSVDNEARMLFVGGNYYPNIQGIKWFAKHVMPKLKYKHTLKIVGRGMEFLRDVPEISGNANIEVVGGVEDLTRWYNMSNLVIGPIFLGDGMKTKTAEALQFGKIYVGTEEALCGYDLIRQYECNTEEEFVEMINSLCQKGIKSYNEDIHNIFDENFSEKSAYKMMKEIIELVRK